MAVLNLPILEMPEVILMYLFESLTHEKLYFVSNFIKISDLEQKLWAFIAGLWRQYWPSFDLDPGV